MCVVVGGTLAGVGWVEEEELRIKNAHAVPLASARQHPEIQKENQAGHSSERTVEGHVRRRTELVFACFAPRNTQKREESRILVRIMFPAKKTSHRPPELIKFLMPAARHENKRNPAMAGHELIHEPLTY